MAEPVESTQAISPEGRQALLDRLLTQLRNADLAALGTCRQVEQALHAMWSESRVRQLVDEVQALRFDTAERLLLEAWEVG